MLIKHFLISSFLSAVISLYGYSQQCGNCTVTPSVALYDLDVQVPQPEVKGERKEGLLAWQQLFWLAKHANAKLYKTNKDCVRFTQPGSSDERKLLPGTTHARLPLSNEDVSRYGNYIVTGYVKRSDNGYLMHMEIQLACNRQAVAAADVSFQLSAESSNTISVAHEAVAKLSPLIEKIKTFELVKRSQNQKFAVAAEANLIKITPVKTKLIAGEQTEFSLELKDCDGVALAGREIVFTEGTTGGTVTPTKVITDASGKAKANFKMTATAGTPAIIKAHTLTQTPQSCLGALFGDAQIDAMPTYKIVVNYNKTLTADMNMNSSEDGVVMKAREQKRDEVSYSFSLLHYLSAVPKDGEQIMVMPQFENDPEYQKSRGSKTVVLHNDGYSESTITDTALELLQSPFGATPSDGTVNRQRYFSTAPLPPVVSLLFENNELVFFSAGVEFPESEEGLGPVSGSFGIEKDNKDYFPLKPKRVTDPNSVYKWVYEFRYHKEDGMSKEGKVFTYGSTEGEGATVQIWRSF